MGSTQYAVGRFRATPPESGFVTTPVAIAPAPPESGGEFLGHQQGVWYPDIGESFLEAGETSEPRFPTSEVDFGNQPVLVC